MSRFFKFAAFIMGLSLFVLSLVQATRPSQADDLYPTVYGDLPGGACCGVYMVTEQRLDAQRVNIDRIVQPQNPALSISPSREWRFAHVLMPRGTEVYLLPLPEGDPVRLPETVADGWYLNWATERDVLYFLGRNLDGESAFYRLSPQDITPERMTDYAFLSVRSVHEQRLPRSEPFVPWVPLFLSLNFLGLAASLRWRETLR
ncbi:MAG: hypothetical protein ACLFTK_08770 [Anaerolineales bacterium]